MRSTTQEMVLWQQKIKARVESGLSVSEWCKRNEIKKNRYYYLSNIISKAQSTNSRNEVEFVEVSSIISQEHEINLTQNNPGDFQVFFKSVQVTVPSNFNEDSLAGLMKVLLKL